MVELLAVLGVLMVLLGLILPSLGGAYSSAKLSREMIQLRDRAVMIAVYTQDHNDTFPFLANLGPKEIGMVWPRAMLAGSYYTHIQQIDSRSDELGHGFSIGMSAAMAYDWQLMRPGHTVPYVRAKAKPVRTSEVLFPAVKGLLFRWENRVHTHLDGQPLPNDYHAFCCTHLWEFPVANADSSVIKGHWMFFNGDRPLYIENEIGQPVESTWLGVRGIDR